MMKGAFAQGVVSSGSQFVVEMGVRYSFLHVVHEAA